MEFVWESSWETPAWQPQPTCLPYVSMGAGLPRSLQVWAQENPILSQARPGKRLKEKSHWKEPWIWGLSSTLITPSQLTNFYWGSTEGFRTYHPKISHFYYFELTSHEKQQMQESLWLAPFYLKAGHKIAPEKGALLHARKNRAFSSPETERRCPNGPNLLK